MVTLGDSIGKPCEYTAAVNSDSSIDRCHSRARPPNALDLATSSVDGVDIDPAVLAVARTHFGLVEGPHLRVHAADGAAYVEKLLADGEEGVYDIIHLDAYTGDGIPAHLTSPAFFGGISRLLSSSGVAILNLGVDDPEEEQQIETRFARAFVSRCAQVRVLDDENLIRFAGHHPPPSQDEMRRIARALDEQERLPFNLEIIAYSRTGCADGS